jgi:hypothetical protein
MDDLAIEKTKTAFLLKIGERWVRHGFFFFFVIKYFFSPKRRFELVPSAL